MYSNLPLKELEKTKEFFNEYFKASTSRSGTIYDALVTFFNRQTKDKNAAESIAVSILESCRLSNTNPMVVLDALRSNGFNQEQQNQYIIALLNISRTNSSYLGFKNKTKNDTIDRLLLP